MSTIIQPPAELYVPELLTSIYELGNWNMNTTGSATNIAHGLDFSKIREIQCTIRNDNDNYRYVFNGNDNHAGTSTLYLRCTSVFFGISRDTNGFFDNTGFQNTGGFNRGWVIAKHIP